MEKLKQILLIFIQELGRSITKMVPIIYEIPPTLPNSYSPVVSEDGRSLTVHIGDLAPEQGMTIRYDVYLDKVPAIDTKYKNNATMTATEIKEQNKGCRSFAISSLMETSMVRNTPLRFTKKVKMVKRLQVLSLQ